LGLLRRLRDFYLIQMDLVVRWRPGPQALLRRTAVSFVVAFIGLSLMTFVPGIHIRDAGSAALAVIVFWALNLLVRPVILALVAPISTALVVALSLVLQVLIVFALGPIVPGVEIDGFTAAFIGSWVFAVANTILTAVFSISEDDSHFGALVRRLRMQRDDAIHTTNPGLVMIQIDGLSHDVLKQQLHAGRAPVMAKMIRSGSHRLTQWEALLPSQTSASQAGILHGNNDGIPAFRWWDKEHNRLLVSNHPKDAAEIIARVSNGRGLLSPGGASINNLASGDAPRAYLTMATLETPGGGLGQSQAFAWFFVSPYNYLHTIVRFVGETLKELFQARRQRRAGVEPILNRGFPYPLLRATTNVALRALGTSLILEEMYRGTPVIYADFTDYDEIAHHSGPERPDALDALDGVDRVIGTLQKAAEDAARPYHFVVLSDHGQTLGATFKQRFGASLEQVVRRLMGGATEVETATARVEEWGPINAFVGELRRAGGLTGRMTRAATRSRGDAAFGPDRNAPTEASAPTTGWRAPADRGRAAEPPELVVCASGNLGLISFPREEGRMTLEAIDERYPRLIDALANHPGIGFVVVQSERRGAICVGRDGLRFLADDTVQGRDPLEAFGEHAATGLRRVDAMPNCPDILAISMYDKDADEIAAFEELIGSHGGLGGAQTRPFLLAPADWPLDDAPLLGAPAIYRQLRAWMEGQLHIAFAADPDTGSGTIRGQEQEEGIPDVRALPEHRHGQRRLPVG
jgi:uncharacterized membrane protein YvlD (DUF360 family)